MTTLAHTLVLYPKSRWRKAVAFVLMLVFTIPGFLRASAEPNPMNELGGHVEAVVDGKVIAFPTLRTDIQADVKGDLVNVTLTQTFANPASVPVNARYLFPLNKDAAVHAMTMEVGDEIVRAVIQEKEEAQQTFEAAREEGKAAALLTQHRPNMFTQDIANLMPNQPVKITLEYVHHVPRVDGAYQLVIPLVVGPRYEPINMPASKKVPDYPEVFGLTLPKNIEKDRVSVKINLDGGMPVRSVTSSTHAIAVTKTSKNERSIRLSKGSVIDNSDFVLHYMLAGDTTQAGALIHRDPRGNFLSLLLEPPEVPVAGEITPREMVFLLDTSGSMSGEPLEGSQIFMREALKNLKPGDYFRIIRFSDTASEYAADPQPATKANIRDGIRFVNGLTADGGTEMISGLDKALDVPPKAGTLRIVVFLTDGYVGNEAEILDRAARKLKGARIYAFGVGTSVNRYLLSEMATIGRGFARYIDPTENTKDVAKDLARRLEAPVLTDIRIDWGSLKVTDATPKKIPDLFAGDSLRIQGKFNGNGTHTVNIRGKINGTPATLPVVINADAQTQGSEAIALTWARARIKDLTRAYDVPYYMQTPEDELRKIQDKVTRLGLDFALVTRWTSFVAVSEKIVNKNPGETVDTQMPLPMVKGVTAKAYPGAGNFSGSAVPEPEEAAVLILMALILGTLGIRRYRRRKRHLLSACREAA